MHENGIVAEASERLHEAKLIPPVGGLMSQGAEEDELVVVEVRGPVSAELESRLSEVLEGLHYEVRSVSPTHSTAYAPAPSGIGWLARRRDRRRRRDIVGRLADRKPDDSRG